jgi:hypothetical protein
MPRFVILEHDHPQLHWDLMLEAGAVLRTWRLAAPPQPGDPICAEPAFDHRPLYLDYEGAVSNNRGTVRRWDGGLFSWVSDESDRVVVRLAGERCRGRAVLERHRDGTWSLRIEAGGD